MKNLIFFFSLLQTSIKESLSKRGSFLFEILLSIISVMLFFSIWWIFFQHINNIAGWNFKDMVVLLAVSRGSSGLMHIFFGGVEEISKMIIEGNLDSYMTQPKNLLLHIVASRSHLIGWGGVISAFIMLLFAEFDVFSYFLIFLGSLCGFIIFTSINIIIHSLPFWLGQIEGLIRRYYDILFLLTLYPSNMYSGFLQIVMFTVIPAAVITYFPVELVRAFSWTNLLILLSLVGIFLGLAISVFYLGLRRYESGNSFKFRI